MKTKYKHIHFEEMALKPNSIWYCRNNKTTAILGSAEFYKSWKKWVFSSRQDAVFDASCLRDIADFLEQLDKSKE